MEAALRKMIINKNSDILDQAEPSGKKVLKTSNGDGNSERGKGKNQTPPEENILGKKES